MVAIDPSPVMLAQRPADSAPCIRAAAEALPFGDGTFGAAMAVLTIHHWRDKPKGLAEMRRVARGPLVLFGGHNRTLNTSWWLHDYFPAQSGGSLSVFFGRTYPVEVLVPVWATPADCADGFEAAYWRRPEAILDLAVWRATSALSLIPASDRAAGMGAAVRRAGERTVTPKISAICSHSTSWTSATASSSPGGRRP